MLSPLFGQLSPLRVPTRVAERQLSDADAITYIAAVETADAQTLEDGVKFAYEDFVLGCKSDGIWSAIKASCILAGARTLSGALVPLVGTAPTNNNFVSGDYNRETGLKGNGASKRINTSRKGGDDPLNDMHMAAFASEISGTYPLSAAGNLEQLIDGRTRNRSSNLYGTNTSISERINKLWAASRNSSSGFFVRQNNADFYFTQISQNNSNNYFYTHSNGFSAFFGGRIAFYSIGESLDLAALDTRVSTLMTDLAAAIP
jgi:hypothetical protein